MSVHIQIMLLDEDHGVWRRIKIPATCSLWDFHAIIQIVFDRHDDCWHVFEDEDGLPIAISWMDAAMHPDATLLKTSLPDELEYNMFAVFLKWGLVSCHFFDDEDTVILAESEQTVDCADKELCVLAAEGGFSVSNERSGETGNDKQACIDRINERLKTFPLSSFADLC